MGILHSSSRYFGCKTQDEDEDEFGRPIYPYLDSPKTSSACSSIVNAILQGIRFLFGLVWRRKAANPVLPIQNKCSSREPLLAQTRNSDDERRSQCGIVNDLYYQQWLEEKKQRNVPAVLEKKMGMKSTDLARLIKGSSSSSIDAVSNEKMGMKSADPARLIKGSSSSSSIDVVSNEKMGMKSADPARLIKSSSSSIDHVVSNEKIGKLLSLQTTNSNSGRSPQWLEKKLVTSSSTLFVQKDAPRNVPVVKVGKKPDPKQEKKVSLIINEKWIKHYSNSHRILLVGEGDFSFSASLALAFSSASNIIATSLNSQAFLLKNYRTALSNLRELSIRGCKVMHEIDATKMCIHPYLGGIKFDRIVFNFPFAGFFKDISRDSQLRRHRKLVSQFLMNAKKMISETGEIHITHKTSEFQMEWKVESMASSHGLRLVEAVDFNHLDYPGYNTKCGFGGDKNFNCYPSKTYKFGLRF